MYPLGGGAGGGAKIGGEQVSDNSMCTSRRWRSGGVALCVVEESSQVPLALRL